VIADGYQSCVERLDECDKLKKAGELAFFQFRVMRSGQIDRSVECYWSVFVQSMNALSDE
jgi:hypothetical protein